MSQDIIATVAIGAGLVGGMYGGYRASSTLIDVDSHKENSVKRGIAELLVGVGTAVGGFAGSFVAVQVLQAVY